MTTPEPLTYFYGPQPPEPLFKEGVTSGYLVNWNGEPGPASVAKVAMLVDGEGVVSIVQTGEFEPCSVVDDQ